MPLNIDYEFIRKLEGGCQTQGYVPDSENGRTGVTIAMGFDLGQRKEQDLIDLGLNRFIVDLLKPYCGYQGKEAERILENHPLKISKYQAEFIDQSVKAQCSLMLDIVYEASVENGVCFVDLPYQAQTVIASVFFQYGIGLESATPKFWKAVTDQDWQATLAILRDFKDCYPTRRHKEANLLAQIA